MRLPSSGRRAPVPAEMLPILNVVLLLLGFFLMLAQPGTALRSAELPRSRSAAPAAAGSVLLRLHADGTLEADGRVLPQTELAAWLRASAATELQLQAPPAVPAQRVLALLAVLRGAGAQRVQLLVSAEAPP
ncbi:MAG: biopolymer transporter ExbD [Pseudomonadota bacterium]